MSSPPPSRPVLRSHPLPPPISAPPHNLSHPLPVHPNFSTRPSTPFSQQPLSSIPTPSLPEKSEYQTPHPSHHHPHPPLMAPVNHLSSLSHVPHLSHLNHIPSVSSPTPPHHSHQNQLPHPHSHPFPPVEFPLPLLSRISSLEDTIRFSPYLAEMISDMSRRTKHIASGVDIDDRIHFTGRKRHDNVLITFGYPRTDEDVDYCLEDTPGLSPENFNLLKSALVHHLSRVRQAATDCVAEVEALLAQQIAFRALPALELDRRLQYVVSRFCKARKQILHKFRGYVRNRRWIENVATRQRRGCLTHRQNNILRLWLFSNFSNPYPDNEDKKKLIQQTHLNMTQINNWLINARSRVWKPTVETMSGERIRKEMNSKEGVRMELRASEMAGEYHKEGEYSTAPRSNGAAHGSHGECLNNTHGVSIPSSTPMNQTHGAQASTSGGDGISDEGAWLGPQNWSSLEFPSDALAN